MSLHQHGEVQTLGWHVFSKGRPSCLIQPHLLPSPLNTLVSPTDKTPVAPRATTSSIFLQPVPYLPSPIFSFSNREMPIHSLKSNSNDTSSTKTSSTTGIICQTISFSFQLMFTQYFVAESFEETITFYYYLLTCLFHLLELASYRKELNVTNLCLSRI